MTKRNIGIYLLFGMLSLALAVFQACSSNPPVVPSQTQANFTGPTYTPTFTFTPCSSQWGNPVSEASSYINSGYIYSNRFYFFGKTISSLSLLTSGTGQFSLAIYSDNAAVTAPAFLITQTAPVSTTVSPGWNTVPLTPPLNLRVGYYWLALQTDTSVTTYYTNTGTTPMPYIAQSFGPFPNGYAGYIACSCSLFSMYATYCP